MQQQEISLRPGPLLDFPVENVFRISDFGAVAGEQKCSTRAIQAAIDAAAQSGVPSRVEFDPGVYRIDVPQDRVALTVRNASHLILDGNGCEFRITEPTKELLAIEGSERVIVKNLAVDFEVLPHTQGWVTEVDAEAGNVAVELDPAYPDLDQPHFREAHYTWAFIKDRNNPVAFKEGTEFRLFVKEWRRTGDRCYVLDVTHKIVLQTVEVGDPFVQISRIDGGLFLARRSADVTFMDLRVFASSNAVFAMTYCDRPNFIRVNATPREGRWLTSGADGCFMFGGRGGPWVEDCHFEAIGDDNLVTKGFPAYCINIVDPYTFDLVHSGVRFDWPKPDFASFLTKDKDHKWLAHPGDTLTVMDPLERAIACRPVVTEFEVLEHGVSVRVDRSISGRVTVRNNREG